jgi:hypothetical protein
MVKRCLYAIINYIYIFILSNFFINQKVRLYSSSTSNSSSYNNKNNKGNTTITLNPYYITGFSDGEGCFNISGPSGPGPGSPRGPQTIYKDSRRGLHTCPSKGDGNPLSNPLKKLNPNYITGFVDGEGSFIVKILKRSRLKVGFEVQLCFQITSHPKDRALLDSIRDYFGGIGSIHKEGSGCLQYRVSSNKDLNLIIKHFEKFPLITKKYADYLLFKSILEICNLKEHLTHEGINKIVNIRASMNKGLTEKLKEAFPDVIPVVRPEVKNQVIKDPH